MTLLLNKTPQLLLLLMLLKRILTDRFKFKLPHDLRMIVHNLLKTTPGVRFDTDSGQSEATAINSRVFGRARIHLHQPTPRRPRLCIYTMHSDI